MGFKGPGYLKVRLVPENTRLPARVIAAGNFIKKHGLVFERAKAVKKTWRNPKPRS